MPEGPPPQEYREGKEVRTGGSTFIRVQGWGV